MLAHQSTFIAHVYWALIRRHFRKYSIILKMGKSEAESFHSQTQLSMADKLEENRSLQTGSPSKPLKIARRYQGSSWAQLKILQNKTQELHEANGQAANYRKEDRIANLTRWLLQRKGIMSCRRGEKTHCNVEKCPEKKKWPFCTSVNCREKNWRKKIKYRLTFLALVTGHIRSKMQHKQITSKREKEKLLETLAVRQHKCTRAC